MYLAIFVFRLTSDFYQNNNYYSNYNSYPSAIFRFLNASVHFISVFTEIRRHSKYEDCKRRFKNSYTVMRKLIKLISKMPHFQKLYCWNHPYLEKQIQARVTSLLLIQRTLVETITSKLRRFHPSCWTKMWTFTFTAYFIVCQRHTPYRS